MPGRCPFGKNAERCKISGHHWRIRSTGPTHPLLVASCAVHGHSFTIYPPGFAPYGRVPVVAVTPNGALNEYRESPGAVWVGTLFEAARDAAQGIAWRPGGPAFTTGRWRTQQRYLDKGLRLLGLHPKSELVRPVIAKLLRVPVKDLCCFALGQSNIGYRGGGQAVAAVLDLLEVRPSLSQELLQCGGCAGLWPPMVSVAD